MPPQGKKTGSYPPMPLPRAADIKNIIVFKSRLRPVQCSLHIAGHAVLFAGFYQRNVAFVGGYRFSPVDEGVEGDLGTRKTRLMRMIIRKKPHFSSPKASST